MSNREDAENFNEWYKPEEDPDYVPDEVWKGEDNSPSIPNEGSKKIDLIKKMIQKRIREGSIVHAKKILNNDKIFVSVDNNGKIITGKKVNKDE